MANAVVALKSTATLRVYENGGQLGLLRDKGPTISDIADELQAGKVAVEVDDTSGAISSVSGLVVLTKAGIAAMTLAAPTTVVDDGKILRILSTTANAHTVTTPSNKIDGAHHLATFTAAGDYITLIAYGGVWYPIGLLNVVVS